jgi:hypothetical protein
MSGIIPAGFLTRRPFSPGVRLLDAMAVDAYLRCTDITSTLIDLLVHPVSSVPD